MTFCPRGGAETMRNPPPYLVNLALRFVLKLCALGALGYWARGPVADRSPGRGWRSGRLW